MQEQGNKEFRKVKKSEKLFVSNPWPIMAQKMQECKYVLSSSLHGIIFAEAFGIPNRRVQLTKKPGNLKFNDFYESYRGRPPNKTSTVKEAEENLMEPLPYKERDAYARRILSTFPIHLFHVIHDEKEASQELQ